MQNEIQNSSIIQNVSVSNSSQIPSDNRSRLPPSIHLPQINSSTNVSVRQNSSVLSNLTVVQNNSQQNTSSSNISINLPSVQIPDYPIRNPSLNVSSDLISGPGIVYYSSRNLMLVIDGDQFVVDQAGALLSFNEAASTNNPTNLFLGTYPSTPPRDLIIHSRVTKDRTLEQWRNHVISQGVERKNIVLLILDNQNQILSRVTFRNSWPSKYRLIVTPNGFEEEVTVVSEAVSIENY